MDNNFQKILFHYGLTDDTSITKAKVICPFHDDAKPSMLVDLINDRFYCFGCGKTGDSLDFVQEIEKCNRLEAMRKIAVIVSNKTLNHLKLFKQPKKSKKECLRDAKIYFYTLPKSKWTKPSQTVQYMLDRGFTSDVMVENGLRENFNFPYGVIAPVLDNNVFKGYVCRAVIDCDRKYLYNTGFSRSTMLCGNYTKKWVIVVEGYMDYLKLRQANINNCVAIFGWKITDYQISKLQRVTDCVISALDNTETGEKGTTYLEQYFKVVRFEFPDFAKDVGDLGVQHMNKALKDTFKKIGEL